MTLLWIVLICFLPSVILLVALCFRPVRKALDRADDRLHGAGRVFDLVLVSVVMFVYAALFSLLTPRASWQTFRANRKLRKENPEEWKRREVALRDVF